MKEILLALAILAGMWYFKGYVTDQQSFVETPFWIALEKDVSDIRIPHKAPMKLLKPSYGDQKGMYRKAFLGMIGYGVRECDCITNGHGPESTPFTLTLGKFTGELYFSGEYHPKLNRNSRDVRKQVDNYRGNYERTYATCVLITKGYIFKHPQREQGFYSFPKDLKRIK
jgi:hypothetical protein